MADISLTTYGKGIDLQVSSSVPSWEGSIYNGGTYTTFNQGTLAKGLVSGSSLALKGGTAMTAILDEDNMVSNSATSLATQQSIRAYVDTQVSGANDLTVEADNGGELTVDLSTDDFNITGSSNLRISGSKVGTNVNFEVCLKDDVTIAQNLDVNGDTSVATFDSSGATSLATGGGTVTLCSPGVMTTIEGTLNVDQAVTFDTTLDVTGDTSVSTFDSSGATSIATGGATVEINTSGNRTNINGTLTVDEAATFSSTIDSTGIVSGSAAGKFLSLALNTNNFEVDSSGNCDTSGYVIADGRGMFGGRLDVTGAFDCATTATIDGATTIGSTLGITGIASGSAAGKFLSLDINSDTMSVDSSGNLDTSGYVIADGRGMFGGRLDVTGAFDCASTSTFDGTMTAGVINASGLASLNAGIAVDTNKFTVADTTGNTVIAGTLNVTGDANFVQLSSSAGAAINGDDGLYVAADGTFGTGVEIEAGGLTVTAGNLTMTAGDITCSDANSEVKAGAFVTYSDAALKTNVETVTNAMDMIQGLRGVSYDLKSGGKREYGFIAQEVNTVVPEVVSTSGNLMGIDYTRITSLLVEAVKTQQAEIIALQEKLDK